jgi:hypothetical protein
MEIDSLYFQAESAAPVKGAQGAHVASPEPAILQIMINEHPKDVSD